MNIKKVLFEKCKIINLILTVIVGVVVVAIYYYVTSGNCVDNCSYELKQGLIDPIYSGGKILVLILAALLILPRQMFRKWLFFIAPPIFLLTCILVSNISVYTNSLVIPTRAKMAENMMEFLAIVTVIFVVGHLLYDWKKKKSK